MTAWHQSFSNFLDAGTERLPRLTGKERRPTIIADGMWNVDQTLSAISIRIANGCPPHPSPPQAKGASLSTFPYTPRTIAPLPLYIGKGFDWERTKKREGEKRGFKSSPSGERQKKGREKERKGKKKRETGRHFCNSEWKVEWKLIREWKCNTRLYSTDNRRRESERKHRQQQALTPTLLFLLQTGESDKNIIRKRKIRKPGKQPVPTKRKKEREKSFSILKSFSSPRKLFLLNPSRMKSGKRGGEVGVGRGSEKAGKLLYAYWERNLNCCWGEIQFKKEWKKKKSYKESDMTLLSSAQGWEKEYFLQKKKKKKRNS